MQLFWKKKKKKPKHSGLGMYWYFDDLISQTLMATLSEYRDKDVQFTD